MWITVTMDNGVVVVIGGGWNLPPSYPNYCSTWIEITGTEGALMLDDTQRDNWLNTVSGGTRFPMSTMPGEQVDHVFAGGMGPETIHFLEAWIRDTPVMVTPESARAGDGDLFGGRSLGRAQRAGRPAAHQRDDVGGRRVSRRSARALNTEESPRTSGSPSSAPAGSACSAARSRRAIRRSNGSASPRRTRTAAARSRPRSGPISSPPTIANCCARPEVTCAIIATDEHLHVDPIMAAVERGVPMLIEKPLATDLAESARVLGRSRRRSSMRWSATPSASAAAGSPPRRKCAPARSAT